MEKKFQEELGHDIKKSHRAETIISFLVLGFVVIGIGVAAWWYLSKTPSYDAQESTVVVKKSEDSVKDETSGWKTYTNDVFDFSLKYPGTWVLTDKLQAVKTDPGAANKPLTIANNDKYTLSLWINPDGFGFEGISKAYAYKDAAVSNKKITLGAKEVSDNPEGDGSFSVNATVTNGTDRYIFSLMGKDSASITEADEFFTKILATYSWL